MTALLEVLMMFINRWQIKTVVISHLYYGNM